MNGSMQHSLAFTLGSLSIIWVVPLKLLCFDVGVVSLKALEQATFLAPSGPSLCGKVDYCWIYSIGF